MRNRFFRRVKRWARRRYGTDPDPSTISTRRIYILPTKLGVAFALMLFAMFIGAMNYANNLALGLSFLLGGLGLTAMHHCHRNLAGVRVRSAGTEPVFAGESAVFRIALENSATLARPELELRNEYTRTTPQRIDATSRVVMNLTRPADQRGWVQLEQFEVATEHPFGLFRAWTYLNMDLRCIVYPRPAPRGRMPPPFETDTGGAQDSMRGDEEFAGLRAFHAGDSPRRIAWKAYARDESLQVKLFAGTAVTSHRFDWDGLQGLDTEARLAQLCRWIEDAYAAGRAFGLRLPGTEIPENIGPAHRQRCLTALALFDLDGPA
ncbi:MAG TPA: DUF58 domain-containing protein [Steroidobacteraceae bacterium]|nr:DUF58 domain-containing protein [Steroidobacteraceae bacterium]